MNCGLGRFVGHAVVSHQANIPSASPGRCTEIVRSHPFFRAKGSFNLSATLFQPAPVARN